ncbi:signal transduction histidine kinase [Bradyrhizobium japonicum]|uniref:sensor histidine kinase n=1 Tax=Bradyrhizobium japonicum TaxID=375 RepID=UPI00339603C0
MDAVEEKKLRFRPRARIIRTIGDQLISGPEAAVIELVKNAYDADATFVSIKFRPPLELGKGRIIIVDDGIGMTLSDIQDKWMEPATTSKLVLRRSPLRDRQMMGSKGIGRFAAAKLGSKMALNSISNRDGHWTEVLIPELDWNLFNGDTYLADISIDYLLQETEGPSGTTIEISNLNETWTSEKLLRLHRELRRLVSPLDKDDADRFGIYLDLSDCTNQSAGFDGPDLLGFRCGEHEDAPSSVINPNFEIRPFPLLDTSDYEVAGSFHPDGRFTGTIEIKRAGQAPRPIKLLVPLRPEEAACGTVSVKLSIFDRETAAVQETVRRAGFGNVTAKEARKILDEIAGVAIYRGGFRIRPYGDPNNDWLTLDTRRVQNPTLRIGHNQIAGYVTVEDEEFSGLVERSSREGFEENGSFRRLYSLLIRLLAETVEPERFRFREDAGISRKKVTSFEEMKKLSELEGLETLVPQLPVEKRSDAHNLIAQQSARLVEKIEALEERQRILEAQSSLGQIISEILHEGAPSATFLAKTGQRLVSRYQHLFNNSSLTEETKSEFPEKLALVRENGEKLQSLFASLRPLSGARRGPPVDFYGVDVTHAVLALFASHHVQANVHVEGQQIRLFGYPEDLNTALVNLVGNSIYWLEQSEKPNPQIDIRFRWQGSEAIIFVDDNGPGIPEEFAEHIFDVGFTLRDKGTGLGLNIAKEALSRSNASLYCHLHFVGGARFVIRFPSVRK